MEGFAGADNRSSPWRQRHPSARREGHGQGTDRERSQDQLTDRETHQGRKQGSRHPRKRTPGRKHPHPERDGKRESASDADGRLRSRKPRNDRLHDAIPVSKRPSGPWTRHPCLHRCHSDNRGRERPRVQDPDQTCGPFQRPVVRRSQAKGIRRNLDRGQWKRLAAGRAVTRPKGHCRGGFYQSAG